MALDFPTPSPNATYSAAGKTWRWNGKAWEAYTPFGFGVSGGFGVKGTPKEVDVSLNGITYVLGLPNDVEVSNSLTTQYLNLNGNTFAGGAGGVTLSSKMSVYGDINITGRLVVDGPIISKTGFSGYTLDNDVESVSDVSLDGGEF